MSRTAAPGGGRQASGLVIWELAVGQKQVDARGIAGVEGVCTRRRLRWSSSRSWLIARMRSEADAIEITCETTLPLSASCAARISWR